MKKTWYIILEQGEDSVTQLDEIADDAGDNDIGFGILYDNADQLYDTEKTAKDYLAREIVKYQAKVDRRETNIFDEPYDGVLNKLKKSRILPVTLTLTIGRHNNFKRTGGNI